MKPRYFFGRVPTRRFDYFAFPRAGSHYFNYCCQGLFDLVWLPTPGFEKTEAIERQAELDPEVLYALDLREDGAPHEPVYIDQRPNGQHGTPVKSEAPAIILIRDPVATVYSYWRVAGSRWGMGDRIADPGKWIADKFDRYRAFYAAAYELVRAHPRGVLLIRFEELAAGPGALTRLVEFVGVMPKLRPEFVHRLTKFEAIARPGQRTFYRAGDNGAWRSDAEWVTLLGRVGNMDFGAFGYAPSGPDLSAARGEAAAP